MKFDESGNSGESVNSCTDIPLDGCDESGDPWISDTEFQDDAAYDRQIAEKSVNRMREQHVNLGIKNGIEKVLNESMQIGFEKGYEIGAPVGARVGRIKGILNALHHVNRILSAMSPPNGEGSAPKLVDHLSRLVESGNELKNALGKFECSLDRQDLFIHFPDSQNNYAGDPSVVVKPNLDALESAEGYVKDFLHKKCRWPLISEFIPPA